MRDSRSRAWPEMMFYRAIAIVIVAGVIVEPCTATSVVSNEPVTKIEWYCFQEFNEKFDVRCNPVTSHSTNSVISSAQHTNSVNIPSTGNTNGHSTGPILRELEGVKVAAHAQQEQSLVGIWKVPLYVRPVNYSSVIYLLQSVLCAAESNCSVQYNLQTDGPRELRVSSGMRVCDEIGCWTRLKPRL